MQRLNVYIVNMSSNDNSVNITDESAGYHHGNLRTALTDAAMAMVAAEGADALSMRKLAAEVGVSATAIYRHFPGRDALLATLGARAAKMLAHLQSSAAKAAGGGLPGLSAAGETYVAFAVDQPALFRLLFSRPADISLVDAPKDEVAAAMRGLRDQVDILMPGADAAAERRAAVIRAWAIVHGLAVLVLDGHIDYDPEDVRRVLEPLGQLFPQ